MHGTGVLEMHPGGPRTCCNKYCRPAKRLEKRTVDAGSGRALDAHKLHLLHRFCELRPGCYRWHVSSAQTSKSLLAKDASGGRLQISNSDRTMSQARPRPHRPITVDGTGWCVWAKISIPNFRKHPGSKTVRNASEVTRSEGPKAHQVHRCA